VRTAIEKSKALYCRRNGRTFRITQGKDKNKRWTLHRIEDINDQGELIGTYQGRGEANKVLERVAYAPERPR
jgi:hypothetical protein